MSCNLGSINLNAFVRNPFTDQAYFDTPRFEEVVKEMIWGLDDMITLFEDRHALPEQVEHVKNWREVGLGIMGLADLALSMKLGYGTPKFVEFLDTTMKVMINAATQASATRAITHGVYPKYNFDNLSKSRFYQETLTDETKTMVKEHGMRNSRLLSIAPTGSISNILGVSGGVEPFFMLGYQRTIKSIFEQERTIWVNEKTPQKLIDHLRLNTPDELPQWAQITSQNIDFNDRAVVQATIQKYVDTAISSTFNLPNEATTDDIEDIYLTAWEKGFKGATVFRDNCKKIGILTGGGEHFDNNPAPHPEIEVKERWTNKSTGEVKEFVNHIVITDSNYSSEVIELEKCPVCGEHLVKKQGCTQCSNPECYFEKCAI